MQRHTLTPLAASDSLQALTPGSGRGGHAIRIHDVNPLKLAVRFLTSIRAAIVLILVIAAIVLAGTIIDQAPPAVIANQAAYERWLATARTRYGDWTDLLDQFQLFNVFHSLLFRGPLALLALSIIVCTIRRFRSVWALAFHSRVRVNESFLLNARFHSRLTTIMPATDAAALVKRTLGRARFRIRTEADGTSVAILADKNRLSRFGTFFTHLGLVLILGGAVAGGVWGFKDDQFLVAEGATRPLGLGTDISVRLDRSVNDYYADGRPKALSSDLTLFEGGKPVAQGTVEVNSPLRYRGIAFHQWNFGQAVTITVRDSTGVALLSEGVPLSLRSSDGLRPVGRVDFPDRDITLLVTGPQTGVPDRSIRPGEVMVDLYEGGIRAAQPQMVAQGKAVGMQDLTITFERESLYAGLKVVKDPGTTIIWVAGALMVLGMMMLFYLPPRRLWALCKSRDDGMTEVLLAMPANRDVSLARDFGRLSNRVARVLGAPEPMAMTPGGADV